MKRWNMPLPRFQAYSLLVFIMAVFVLFHADQISNPLPHHGDYPLEYVQSCALDEIPNMRAPLEKWLMCASYSVFGSQNALPFGFTAALIPLTFVLARRITKNEKASLVASSLILFSPIIGFLGTTGALTTDWAFFFLLSMYMGYRRPELVGPIFFAGLACKALPVLFVPFLAYFVYKSDMKRKRLVIVSYVGVFAVSMAIWASGDSLLIQQDGFGLHPDMIPDGLDKLWYVFRSDPLQYFVIPAAIVIGMTTKNPVGRPLAMLMAFYWLLCLLFPVFSMYKMYDYRMVPLIILAAITVTSYRSHNHAD